MSVGSDMTIDMFSSVVPRCRIRNKTEGQVVQSQDSFRASAALVMRAACLAGEASIDFL